MASREFHDASFKRWFGHGRMVEDLLRLFGPPGVVAGLDFATLRQLPADYIADDLARGSGDAVWRVRFRGDAEDWLYLLVLLEFQSTVDRHMAARILAYTAQMYLKLIRNRLLPADGRLPPVLPIVIYNGERRWSAASEVGETIASVGEALAPFQPRQRHLVIDEHALRVEDLPEENVVSAQIALEQGSVSTMASVLRRVSSLLPGEEDASLRRAFAELTLGMVARSAAAREHPDLPEALRAAAETGGLSTMGSLLARRIDEYIETNVKAGVEAGIAREVERVVESAVAREVEDAVARTRAETLERSRTESLERERALLLRLASRRFGADAGARLAALLAGVSDLGRLAEIGDLVVDCADGDELLARARERTNRR